MTINGVGPHVVAFDPITVTPGNNYNIHLNHAATGSESWAYTSDANCYSLGSATYGSGQAGVADFYFSTMGYNNSDQSSDTGSSATSNQTSTTPTANQQPNTTTSASIQAPTNLKAIDVPGDSGGAVQLSWTASATATIDGYRIYRSTKSDSDFLSIGQATKDTPSFIDYKATTGQKYYYYVRAYLATTESADSNHVSQASVDNSAKTTPKTFMQKYGTWVWVGTGVLILLIAIVITAVIISTRKKAKSKA